MQDDFNDLENIKSARGGKPSTAKSTNVIVADCLKHCLEKVDRIYEFRFKAITSKFGRVLLAKTSLFVSTI